MYADTRFSNFAIEYLLENKKVRELVFACSYGAQVECFKQNKNGRKSRDTVPLMDQTMQNMAVSFFLSMLRVRVEQ